MILGGETKNRAVVVVTRVRTTIHIHFVIGKIIKGPVECVWSLAAMTRASPLSGFETMLDKCDQPPLLQI